MPKSSAIDKALQVRLASDATLTALMSDGVHVNTPSPGLKHFVVLTLISHEDVGTFPGRREYEDALYRIVAVEIGTSATAVATAADQIDALLENVALVVADYTWMTTHREGRIHEPVVDPVDPSVHWQVSGGNYRVQMAPVWAVAELKE